MFNLFSQSISNKSLIRLNIVMVLSTYLDEIRLIYEEKTYSKTIQCSYVFANKIGISSKSR